MHAQPAFCIDGIHHIRLSLNRVQGRAPPFWNWQIGRDSPLTLSQAKHRAAGPALSTKRAGQNQGLCAPGRQWDRGRRIQDDCRRHPGCLSCGTLEALNTRPTTSGGRKIMTEPKDIPPNFEQSLLELETLVQQMEQGKLSLEDTLERFARGVDLTRSCRQALGDAEQKVDILLKREGEDEPVNFEPRD